MLYIYTISYILTTIKLIKIWLESRAHRINSNFVSKQKYTVQNWCAIITEIIWGTQCPISVVEKKNLKKHIYFFSPVNKCKLKEKRACSTLQFQQENRDGFIVSLTYDTILFDYRNAHSLSLYYNLSTRPLHLQPNIFIILFISKNV